MYIFLNVIVPKIVILFLLTLCLRTSIQAVRAEQIEEPEFTEPVENLTVPAGREVKLSCSVKNLGQHKVAWIHFEGSAILTVQTHVITRNPRIKVTHDKHRTWYLHIEEVQSSDAGRYMCQINTETARTQFGYLQVVVPPKIDDSMSSSDVIVRENSNVSLSCHATGSPKPTVKWQREDKKEMKINKSLLAREYEGEHLELSRISRLEMGYFLCVASNGVPPAVSKRIKVSVDFPPMVRIQHQLIGSPPGYTAVLECETEAHPISLNYWTREDGHMIHESKKYRTESVVGSPSYVNIMRLSIHGVEERDYGAYKCMAKNPRGETEGNIRLYATPSPTTIPPPTTTTIKPKHTDQREIYDISTNGRNLNSLVFSEKGTGGYQSSMNKSPDKSEQRFPPNGDSYEWQEGSQPSSSRQLHSVSSTILICTTFIPFIFLRRTRGTFSSN